MGTITRKLSSRKSFGKIDQDTSISSVLNLVEGDDKPQSFEDVEVDLMLIQQLQQLLSRQIAVVCAHAEAPETSRLQRVNHNQPIGTSRS
jgi:hypothetical protein